MPAQACEHDCVGLAIEHGVDVFQVDAAARQFGPVGRFGHVRLGAEQIRRPKHGLLEGQILKCMQGVVMDENADGTLLRKQVRNVRHCLAQFLPPRLRRQIVLAQTTTAGWNRNVTL